jgi:hypothetical protein
MAKGKANTKADYSKQTTSGGGSGSEGVDANTQAYIDQMRQAAQNAGSAVPGSVTGAQNYYTGAMGAGQSGYDALSGNAEAAQKFMNPYQSQVLDQMTKQFGVQNKMTENQMNDAATRAGAFGGSRHGVATGVALGENQRNQASQYAGLLNSGFEGAMGRAGQVAGMGFDAAGAGANLGMTAGSPDAWRLQMLRQGFQGTPYGRTYTNRNDQATTRAGGSFEGSLRLGI